MKKIGFGGGCHWCTEAVFQHVAGVSKVEQGWIESMSPHDNFSEAVIVHYDESTVKLCGLINVHLRTHSCTSDHSMRGKYRSGVYTFKKDEVLVAKTCIQELQKDFEENILTMVLPFIKFKENKEDYQNYYLKNPEKQFCKRYIEPKLKVVKTLNDLPFF